MSKSKSTPKLNRNTNFIRPFLNDFDAMYKTVFPAIEFYFQSNKIVTVNIYTYIYLTVLFIFKIAIFKKQ